jgi:hypothetical protein
MPIFAVAVIFSKSSCSVASTVGTKEKDCNEPVVDKEDTSHVIWPVINNWYGVNEDI